MMRRAWVWIGVAGLALILAAGCGPTETPQSGDPPLLTGFEALPKQIVTIALTATPTPVIVGGETVPVAQATPTSGPPRPTATLTPYVGVFLGQPTSESGAPAPTLAPIVINPGITGGIASGVVAPAATGSCSIPAAGIFGNAFLSVQPRLGCPLNAGTSVAPMVTQPFERGVMFWRGDTRQIYALASNGQFWQTPDSWNEGMPADDPAFAPPGGLLQPVRGFGWVWRNTGAIRDALGWATLPEAQYNGFWQDFERGAMLLGDNGRLYALFSAEGQHSGPLSP